MRYTLLCRGLGQEVTYNPRQISHVMLAYYAYPYTRGYYYTRSVLLCFRSVSPRRHCEGFKAPTSRERVCGGALSVVTRSRVTGL